jgi:hypothetical protein
VIDGLLDRLDREVLAWPGVSTERGRFQSTVYKIGRRELGHVHGNGVADFPFPRAVRDELLAAGRVQPHHVGAPGYVSYRILQPADVAAAVALFRLNYERGDVVEAGAR